MAWRKTKVEDQRKKIVDACIEGKHTVADLCRMYEISRKSAYKWLERYKSEGEEGLKDRSRAPHRQSLKTDHQIIEEILKVRLTFPSWGPKKILAYLEKHQSDISWPSTTTIGNLLDVNGLVIPRKLRKRVPARTAPLAHCQMSNDVWCADFKGWFLTGDGNKCDPFTLTDGASRYLLRCLKLENNTIEHVWAVLDIAFREYGLPLFLRNDNGPPFGSIGAGRLTRLSVNLIKAGVTPEWIDPGKPQQNGRHERMHGTLKNETANPPQLTLEEQAMQFKEFRNYYNHVRPHEAIGQKTPGSIYQPSPRMWNGVLKAPEYSNEYILRKVRPAGQISMKPYASEIYISTALVHEYIGLKQIEELIYEAHYGPIYLGRINLDAKKLILPEGIKRKRN